MYELVRFKKEHSDFLFTKGNEKCGFWAEPYYAEQMENQAYAFTGIVHKEIAVSGGAIEQWPGRYFLWVLFNTDFVGARFIPVFTLFQEMIHRYLPKGRLEFANHCDDKRGSRRAEMLGFTLEAECMKEYYPGSNWQLWAKVNK